MFAAVSFSPPQDNLDLLFGKWWEKELGWANGEISFVRTDAIKIEKLDDEVFKKSDINEQ